MNIKQKIALLESAKTDIVGGDSWLGIIDECTDIPDYIEKREYEQVEDSLVAVEYLWRRMYSKLENLIYESDHDLNVVIKTEPVISCQNPCDKVSHGCHIEYDKVSHGSCFDCVHCEQGQELDGSESLFCHHDDVKDGKELPVSDCPLWEKDNGSVPR